MDSGVYTATLLVMVNVMKGGGRPPPSPAWANFTLMMECTSESSRYYSVYSIVHTFLLDQPAYSLSPENITIITSEDCKLDIIKEDIL